MWQLESGHPSLIGSYFRKKGNVGLFGHRKQTASVFFVSKPVVGNKKESRAGIKSVSF